MCAAQMHKLPGVTSGRRGTPRTRSSLMCSCKVPYVSFPLICLGSWSGQKPPSPTRNRRGNERRSLLPLRQLRSIAALVFVTVTLGEELIVLIPVLTMSAVVFFPDERKTPF
jgi:hypothetical protein